MYFLPYFHGLAKLPDRIFFEANPSRKFRLRVALSKWDHYTLRNEFATDGFIVEKMTPAIHRVFHQQLLTDDFEAMQGLGDDDFAALLGAQKSASRRTR
jgi:hypothetical protein